MFVAQSLYLIEHCTNNSIISLFFLIFSLAGYLGGDCTNVGFGSNNEPPPPTNSGFAPKSN